jgi:hypothetical protein
MQLPSPLAPEMQLLTRIRAADALKKHLNVPSNCKLQPIHFCHNRENPLTLCEAERGKLVFCLIVQFLRVVSSHLQVKDGMRLNDA